MSFFPTPDELAKEAREALSRRTETPAKHFDRLVKQGWINRQGELTRLLGGEAEPEPDCDSGLRKRPDFNTIMSCDFIPDLFRTATAGLVPVGALTDWL
ncbi:MAG TPA: hypothetical protein VF278_12025, partial [Pirellulales bacterium]